MPRAKKPSRSAAGAGEVAEIASHVKPATKEAFLKHFWRRRGSGNSKLSETRYKRSLPEAFLAPER